MLVSKGQLPNRRSPTNIPSMHPHLHRIEPIATGRAPGWAAPTAHMDPPGVSRDDARPKRVGGLVDVEVLVQD